MAHQHRAEQSGEPLESEKAEEQYERIDYRGRYGRACRAGIDGLSNEEVAHKPDGAKKRDEKNQVRDQLIRKPAIFPTVCLLS